MFRRTLLLIFLSLIPFALPATPRDSDAKFLLAMSLEELGNIPIDVVSLKQLPLRESPGIVTVITEEEIVNSGARDLVDLLRLVPGLDFGVDVANITGIGMRGSWAHEGKVLLLIDGIELNERSYGTTQFGNHYPLEQIKRIEVVRGPGSVVHGGFAGLGVINMITREAEDLQGSRVSTQYGQMKSTYGNARINWAWGEDNGESKLKGMLTLGKGQRSERDYTDFNGNTLAMDDTGRLDQRFILFNAAYKGFNARFIQDRYQVGNRDAFGRIFSGELRNDFNTDALLLSYQHDLDSELEFNASLGYSRQSAWERRYKGNLVNEVATNRWQGRARFNYEYSPDLSITAGGELTRDLNEDKLLPESLLNYRNAAVFTEVQYNSALGILTAGLRYDHHDTFGNNLLPRLGITKAFNDWHFKALFSKSFRTPTIENYRLNNKIEAETAKVYELETGYRFNTKLQITGNIFRIDSQDAILYGVLPGTENEGYFNAEEFSTQGAEMELRYRSTWGYLTFNHSYYQVRNNTLDSFKVYNFQDGSEQNRLTLGFPAHKSTLNMHFNLSPYFSINPSLIFLGSRYGYTGRDGEGNPLLSKFNSAWQFNLYFRYQDFLLRNFNIGLGVYDLFGENIDFIQPYNGGHAPLPGASREIMLKLEYAF